VTDSKKNDLSPGARFATGVAIALLLASAARAADESTLYLCASGGGVRTSPGLVQADFDALVAASGPTDIQSNVGNNDSGFKVQVGWNFAPNFALEVGYVGLGSSRYTATFTDGTAQAAFKAGGIVVDVLGIAPLGGDFSLYGRLGLIAATVVTSFTQSGPAGLSVNTSGTDGMVRPNFGFGFAYDLSKSTALRLEVERFSHLRSSSSGTNDMDMVSFGFLLKL
jgi:OmpA-OmpF porin, OOP family